MAKKKVIIGFDYCDYPSISNSEFKGAIGMMEDAIDGFKGVEDFDVKTKGYNFGSGVIEVECDDDLDVEELLEDIRCANECGYDWKVGDSYEFHEII
jgi:hypothetical protein